MAIKRKRGNSRTKEARKREITRLFRGDICAIDGIWCTTKGESEINNNKKETRRPRDRAERTVERVELHISLVYVDDELPHGVR
jgi:hypothetical protein